MKILYICTHNRCRSILSEALTNHISQGKIIAQSAGSQPAEAVHPLTLKYLQQANINTHNLYSKSIDATRLFKPDVVITVCDSAAQESCPIFFGDAVKLHWGLKDPSKISDAQESEQAFIQVMGEIRKRVNDLMMLSQQDKSTWKRGLQILGENQ